MRKKWSMQVEKKVKLNYYLLFIDIEYLWNPKESNKKLLQSQQNKYCYKQVKRKVSQAIGDYSKVVDAKINKPKWTVYVYITKSC